MIEYWRTYGRIVTDARFEEDLLAHERPGAKKLAEVGDLYYFLQSEGYRFSRWEVMELNRTLGNIKSNRSTTAGMQSRWVGPPAEGDTACLLGVLCIDHVFRTKVLSRSATGSDLLGLLSEPPRFSLKSQVEAIRVASYLSQSQADLDAMEEITWVVPGVPPASCWNGFSRDQSNYEHVNPALLSARLKELGISAAAFDAFLLSPAAVALSQHKSKSKRV